MKPNYWKMVWFLVAVVLGLTIGLAPINFGSGTEEKGGLPAQRCLGLMTTVIILWSTSAIPSHMTGFLIPLVAVVARVMCVPKQHEFAEDSQLLPATSVIPTPPSSFALYIFFFLYHDSLSFSCHTTYLYMDAQDSFLDSHSLITVLNCIWLLLPT